MDVNGKVRCCGRRAFAALARGLAAAALALAAGRGFGEGIAFSSNWSTYFAHNDAVSADSVSALAFSDNTLFLAGVLGGSYLYDNNNGKDVFVFACNDSEKERNDAFAAYLSVSGGLNAYPVFSLLGTNDDSTVHNTFTAVSVAGGTLVCAGAVTEPNAWEFAEATVVRYDADSLEETWRFTLPGNTNSAFHAVSIDSAGSVYAAGFTACATNGFRPGGLVYKFDSSGGVAWSNLLGGGVSCRVNASAVRGDDALYVGGTATNGAGLTVGFLKRLDLATGTEAYAATLDTPVAALAVDGDGDILLGGAGMLCKLADSGSGFTRLWTTNLAASASITALAVGASNRVAVAGTASSAWFEATDGTAFNGPRSGFAVVLPPDGGAPLFAAWIGGDGETTADAVAFSDDVLAVGGKTKATNLASGGFCDTNWNYEARWNEEDPYEPCGYVKVWLGETFIPNPPGALQVFLQPADAVDAGAAWSVDGGATWLASGALLDLPEGTYPLTYRVADEYTLPVDPLAVTIESGATNILYATYPEQVKPFATRFIDGTNITLRLVLPEGIRTADVEEVLPNGLTPCDYDTGYWRWRSNRRILQYTLDLDAPSVAGETIYATYTVSGAPGMYYLDGEVTGDYDAFYAQSETNAVVFGDAVVTIRDPSAVVIPPVPDITAFMRTDAGWRLTFVSTQNVSYAVLTNATPVFGGAEYATIEGDAGTTTVTVPADAPRLFFKIRSK